MKKHHFCFGFFPWHPNWKVLVTHMFDFQEEKTRIWRDASSISNRWKPSAPCPASRRVGVDGPTFFFRIFLGIFFCVGRQKQKFGLLNLCSCVCVCVGAFFLISYIIINQMQINIKYINSLLIIHIYIYVYTITVNMISVGCLYQSSDDLPWYKRRDWEAFLR